MCENMRPQKSYPSINNSFNSELTYEEKGYNSALTDILSELNK